MPQIPQEGSSESMAPVLSKKASDLVESICMILEYMYTRDSVYRDDYRMAVVQSQVGFLKIFNATNFLKPFSVSLGIHH